jgi:osmotically-inducible protein OsmY
MTRGSNHPLALLAGLGLGAALMYFLDPDRGTRRRHLASDQAGRSLRKIARRLRDQASNARNHARGKAVELGARLRDERLDDDVLVARVRAALGHRVRHTGAIEVTASDGAVMLRGPVLAVEADDVIRTVAAVRGVRSIENRMNVRASADDLPALQG